MKTTIRNLFVIFAAGVVALPTVAECAPSSTEVKPATTPFVLNRGQIPGQYIRSLQGQAVRALPGQLVRPLAGQIVPLLPGQLVRPLPGQIVRALPGQIVSSLPGELAPRLAPY